MILKLKKGDLIGKKYSVDQVLSYSGGTASIYLCSLLRDQNISVVVKLSKHDVDDAGHESKLLEREALLLSSWEFRHPGVVRIFPIDGCDLHGNKYTLKDVSLPARPNYMVLEYLKGGSMADAKNRKRIPQMNIFWKMECFYQILITVASLHAKGYGHRDLKPDNIVFREPITNNSVPKPVLIDFALATNGKNRHTDIVDKAMTLEYSPPERVLRSMGPQYDDYIAEDPIKSDIYSLGIILYELITGELPFKGSRNQIRTTIVSNQFEINLEKNKNLYENASILTTMIRGMTQKDPQKRPRINMVINAVEAVFRPPLVY